MTFYMAVKKDTKELQLQEVLFQMNLFSNNMTIFEGKNADHSFLINDIREFQTTFDQLEETS